jgi:hypothetical protein
MVMHACRLPLAAGVGAWWLWLWLTCPNRLPQMQPKLTNYQCRYLQIKKAGKRHMTAFEPLARTKYLHHLGFYACPQG